VEPLYRGRHRRSARHFPKRPRRNHASRQPCPRKRWPTSVPSPAPPQSITGPKNVNRATSRMGRLACFASVRLGTANETRENATGLKRSRTRAAIWEIDPRTRRATASHCDAALRSPCRDGYSKPAQPARCVGSAVESKRDEAGERSSFTDTMTHGSSGRLSTAGRIVKRYSRTDLSHDSAL
jgi:hypothetical protein